MARGKKERGRNTPQAQQKFAQDAAHSWGAGAFGVRPRVVHVKNDTTLKYVIVSEFMKGSWLYAEDCGGKQ
jgi:hypothetical protein